MSISAQQAAQQLKYILSNLLLDQYYQSSLNRRLLKDLKSCRFPETPGNFEDACIFFREFFAEISNPKILSFRRGIEPMVFANILLAIKNFGSRLRAFRNIIFKTCQEHCHYEAFFAVMCDAIHHPVGYFERFNSQNGRDFLLKGMIMLRIEQRRKFPPAPNCELTYLFHFSLDKILGMMKRKNGMHDHADTRSHMERSLRIYNSYWNEQYSAPIRRLLQENPNFFSNWESQLETFLKRVRIYYKERFWLILMENMNTNFWNALNEAGINHEAKSWILYWYLRYSYNPNFEPDDRESFNDLMTRIVQPGEMAFPFKNPPRLVKGDGWGTFEAALKWVTVPTSDLLEICYRSHIKSQYGPVPSQCVLAASVRRKLYEVKITKATIKIQKFARRSLWQFYLKRLIAAMIIKKRVLRVVTPILHVKRAKLLIASAVNRFFIQETYFVRLERYRYLQQINARIVIKKVIIRKDQQQKYIIQKKAAIGLSRFMKVRSATIVRRRLEEFVKNLSCYDCPLCFENFDLVPIGVIQPCGHIHCKDCFVQIGDRCPCCRATFMNHLCKNVGSFLSQPEPKFFFTRENQEKKIAIAVIIRWWVMKRHLVTRI